MSNFKKFLIVTLASVLSVFSVNAFAINDGELNDPDSYDYFQVSVTKGDSTILSLTGADCGHFFRLLPMDVRSKITDEWDKFMGKCVYNTTKTYSGVEYYITDTRDDGNITFTYKGYKIKIDTTVGDVSCMLHNLN